MALFDKPPADFPIRYDGRDLPLSFTLKADTTDKVVVALLALFWAVFGPVLIYLVGSEILSEMFEAGATQVLLVLLCVAFVVGWGFYVRASIEEHFRETRVRIEDGQVSVHQKLFFAETSWSDPVDQFEGVALLNLGNHSFGEETTYVSSVVLKHPDPDKSVPLVIDRQKFVGRKTVQKLAKTFSLPVLEGVGDESGEQAYPEATLVDAKARGMLVSVVFWIMTAAMVGFGLFMIFGGDEELAGAAWWTLPLLALMIFVFDQFCARFVTQMRVWEGDVYIRTAAVRMQEYRVAPEDFIKLYRFKGRSRNDHRATPFIIIFVKGRWVPFLIDLQSAYVDEKGLKALCD